MTLETVTQAYIEHVASQRAHIAQQTGLQPGLAGGGAAGKAVAQRAVDTGHGQAHQQVRSPACLVRGLQHQGQRPWGDALGA